MGLATRLRAFADFDDDEYEEQAQPSEAYAAQAVLVKPSSFDEAGEIASQLITNRIVIMNLETVTKEVARRLLDFLSGTAYAKGGQVRRVAKSTYVLLPYYAEYIDDFHGDAELGDLFL